LEKVYSRNLADNTPTHSFSTLLGELGTLTRSTFRRHDAAKHEATFTMLTKPSSLHQRAFDLLAEIQL